MSVSFFLSHENIRNCTTCLCFILCNLQTAVLAAATLLFLIALPLVNCRRRNTLRIEELDDNLSLKGYDHGKRENTMNQAVNAYFREKELRETYYTKFYSAADVCRMLSDALSKCKNNNLVHICNASRSKDEPIAQCTCDRYKDCRVCHRRNSHGIRLFH